MYSIKEPQNIDIVFPNDFCPDDDSKILDLPASYAWKKDRFIFVYPKPSNVFTRVLAIQQTVIVSEKFFEKGKDYAVICDVRNANQIDKETRDYYSSPEAAKDLFAFVFIVDSIFSQVIANFFINMKTTPIPVRMFNDVAKAENWLNELKVRKD